MADTTLNKRIADLAKKLGVSPESIFTELRDFHKTIATKVAPEIGGLPLNNDQYDAFTPAFEVAEKKGPEWSRLYRSYYDKEEGEGAYNTVINDYLQNYPYDLSKDGMLGYSQKPDGSFVNKNQEDETILEEFEEETGDAASPDRPKPKPTAPKTLEQPEGGATQPAGPTGIGQRIKDLNDAAQSLPANVPLGTGGATTGNRARMNMQAEANRQIGDLIKQQKKQSDQNNFLRDRYDATGGRRAGAFDRLSDQQKDEAVKNYSGRSRFDDSNVFAQAQYQQLKDSGYTPPMADAQSQYEAASMNPPSVARADGTATTDEFGNMSADQQNAFIQNYRYNPQGQAPETVQEGTMGSALEASNPMDNLDTVTVPGQYTAPKKVYPAPDSATEGDRGGIDVSEIFKQNPALQMDGEGNMLPPSSGNPGDDIKKYTPPDVSNMPPIEDVFANLPPAPSRPEAPYSPPDVSNMRPIDDVFNDLPQAPGRPQPQRAPAPAPIAKAPPPPPPAPKQSMETPVYGKKKDGSYGVIGHRNREEMQKSMGGQRVKEWTASMERDRRDADFTNQARRGEIANPFGTDYNRALGQPNEDAYAKKRRSQPTYNPYSA